MARTKATRIVAIAKAFDKSITESGTALASATSRGAASELIEYATRSHTVPVDVLLSLTDALEVLRLQYIALAASVSGVPVDGYAEYAITRSALKFAMLHRDNKTDTALAHDHAYAIVKYAARAASPPRAVLNVLRNAVAVFDRQLAEETAALAHVEAEADALAAAPPPLLGPVSGRNAWATYDVDCRAARRHVWAIKYDLDVKAAWAARAKVLCAEDRREGRVAAAAAAGAAALAAEADDAGDAELVEIERRAQASSASSSDSETETETPAATRTSAHTLSSPTSPTSPTSTTSAAAAGDGDEVVEVEAAPHVAAAIKRARRDDALAAMAE